MAKTDDRRPQGNPAGTAEQKWPDLAEKIRSLQAAELLTPEPLQGLTTQLTGRLSLGTPDRREQPLNVVRNPVNIVLCKLPLVSPAIAVLTQLTDQTALDKSQLLPEEIIPVIPHEDQQ
ncbi:MAG: hypothetical protein RL215_3501 [Planctomycetota bacterium]